MTPSSEHEVVVPLRDRLLSATLKNAWSKPFYRDLWARAVSPGGSGEPVLPRTVEELVDLPLLDRATYRASFMHVAPATCEGTFISHTKGTSGEDLLWRYRTQAERRVIASLFGKAWSGSPCIALSMRWPQHGMGMPIPAQSLVIPGNPFAENGLHQALRVLETEHHFGTLRIRPTVLSGHASIIAELGELVLREGARERLAVDRIFMAGALEGGSSKGSATPSPPQRSGRSSPCPRSSAAPGDRGPLSPTDWTRT